MSGVITSCDQLAIEDFNALDFQFSRLPDLAASYSNSGEHYLLMNLLNKLGYYPSGREEAIELAERLLSNGHK